MSRIAIKQISSAMETIILTITTLTKTITTTNITLLPTMATHLNMFNHSSTWNHSSTSNNSSHSSVGMSGWTVLVYGVFMIYLLVLSVVGNSIVMLTVRSSRILNERTTFHFVSSLGNHITINSIVCYCSIYTF